MYTRPLIVLDIVLDSVVRKIERVRLVLKKLRQYRNVSVFQTLLN